jgi:hypothetical protein
VKTASSNLNKVRGFNTVKTASSELNKEHIQYKLDASSILTQMKITMPIMQTEYNYHAHN